MAVALLAFFQFAIFVLITAQNISTTAVPPLQWINLSGLLQGTNRPPPLKSAAIGYDESSRSIIIFGGISASGIPQSQTYLLNLDTLSWSIPSPPANLKQTPSARSDAVFGTDFAASNRHGFVVIGGKDSTGAALSDIWEYDFTNQFWSTVTLSPGGPSARWGAAGGIDSRTMPISDPVLPGPNNTFYLAGGFDGKTASSLSDVWELSISGTLSSNMPNSVAGSWRRVNIGTLPGRIELASTVIGQQIIAGGGCDSSTAAAAVNSTCARQDSFVINVENQSDVTPSFCPAPRAGPVLVPNLNGFSTSFASQVFLLLGTLDTTLWNDSNGLNGGEVAILDINAGTWTRIIPSGDPGSSGAQQFPSPREGASAISFSQGLVGSSRSNFADTIVFGGQGSDGTYSSDLWLLRSYSGEVTSTSLKWAGFGNGQLATGVDASGTGVAMQYLTQCASRISKPAPSSTKASSTTSPSKTSTPSASSTPSPSSPVEIANPHALETKFSHKLLLPLSIVLFLPFILLLRWWDKAPILAIHERPPLQLVTVTLLGLGAYGLGLAGFVFSFTTIHYTTTSDPHKKLHLSTTHGIVGLVFFICLYALVPLLYLIKLAAVATRAHSDAADARSQRTESGKSISLEMDEKVDVRSETTSSRRPAPRPQSVDNANLFDASTSASVPATPPRARSMSWDAFTALRPGLTKDDSGLSAEGSTGSATAPTPVAPAHKGFEVTNRPNRTRKTSEPWRTSASAANHNHSYYAHTQTGAGSAPQGRQPLPSTRKLGEVDWLLRRRSLNAVGELDFAITQAHNAQYYASKNGGAATDVVPPVVFPSHPATVLRHVLLQTSILGLCALALSALWDRAPRYLFALFLVWTIVYLLGLLLLAYHGRPTSPSLLSTTIWRLRGGHEAETNATPPIPSTPHTDSGPYRHHRPPVRPASTLMDEHSHLHSPLSVCTDDDDDMDEDTRQRLIEEEMERRDVSIVTVPRRKLVLANPS